MEGRGPRAQGPGWFRLFSDCSRLFQAVPGCFRVLLGISDTSPSWGALEAPLDAPCEPLWIVVLVAFCCFASNFLKPPSAGCHVDGTRHCESFLLPGKTISRRNLFGILLLFPPSSATPAATPAVTAAYRPNGH